MKHQEYTSAVRSLSVPVAFYLCCVLLFQLFKPVFVYLQAPSVREGIGPSGILQIMGHGLPLDLATAGYLTALVWFFSCPVSLSQRVRKPFEYAGKVYAILCACILPVLLIGDACLYGFWGNKLDATVWNYLAQPEGALNSVEPIYVLKVILSILFVGVSFYYILRSVFRLRRTLPTLVSAPSRAVFMTLWILLGGLIFLGIRGGIGRSTANVGMVYFSDRAFVNHAAVNPVFSLLASSFKVKDFSKQARYYDESERKRLWAMMHYSTESTDTEKLLLTDRPNVLIILMEGCGAEFVRAVNPEADASVTPHLNRLAAEGIVFTQCYANSFRTDRGTVCTLSGYPSFPDVSVMKLAGKCDRLPSIARTLSRAGYSTHFLYGGDIDFTNTRGYLRATGYDDIQDEKSFDLSLRRTHAWGVTDRITFDSLFVRLQRLPRQLPWHVGFLTLASHEPWTVPYDRIPNNPVANSMAYLDDCLGKFVTKLRQSPLWENTLVVLLPDHGINYGALTDDSDERKSHIPLIFTGGAVKVPRKVESICNQSDLAATLLGQLGLPHDDFRLSRDVLSTTYTHSSAVHTWQEGIYYKDSTGISVVNLLTKPTSIFRESPHPSKQRVNAAKAYLQTAYDMLQQQ